MVRVVHTERGDTLPRAHAPRVCAAVLALVSGVVQVACTRGGQAPVVSPRRAQFHNNSAATLEDVVKHYQALLARWTVIAPKSAFINPPFGPFTDAETPALLAYLKRI